MLSKPSAASTRNSAARWAITARGQVPRSNGSRRLSARIGGVASVHSGMTPTLATHQLGPTVNSPDAARMYVDSVLDSAPTFHTPLTIASPRKRTSQLRVDRRRAVEHAVDVH